MKIYYQHYKTDYEIPTNSYALLYLNCDRAKEDRRALSAAFMSMGTAFLNAGDVVVKYDYGYIKKHQYSQKGIEMADMAGPIIRLYGMAVENVVKAIACLAGKQEKTHELCPMFTRVCETPAFTQCFSSDMRLAQIREHCIEFLHMFDKNSKNGQYGRYPIDSHGKPLGISKASDGEQGYVCIAILSYSCWIHQGINGLTEIYKRLSSEVNNHVNT